LPRRRQQIGRRQTRDAGAAHEYIDLLIAVKLRKTWEGGGIDPIRLGVEVSLHKLAYSKAPANDRCPCHDFASVARCGWRAAQTSARRPTRHSAAPSPSTWRSLAAASRARRSRGGLPTRASAWRWSKRSASDAAARRPVRRC